MLMNGRGGRAISAKSDTPAKTDAVAAGNQFPAAAAGQRTIRPMSATPRDHADERACGHTDAERPRPLLRMIMGTVSW
jgi:hypothetical protein